MESVFILAVMCVTSAVPIWYFVRQQRIYAERVKRLRPPNTTFTDYSMHLRMTHPSQAADSGNWECAILFGSNKHLVAFPTKISSDEPIISILGHEIQGFWRSEKYTDGINRIEIHANIDGQWTILRAKLTKSRMQALVRTLKALVDDDIVRSYRQRRPYVYHPPDKAYLAVQDVYGMWTYDSPFTLYMTPATLVFMASDERVERVIQLRDIQNLRVVQPQESGLDSGLIAFNLTSTEEEIAVVLDDYEAWSLSIAQAARRTLEDPVTRKGKQLEDDLEWDSDFDPEEWEAFDYVLGDDGELHPRQAKRPSS